MSGTVSTTLYSGAVLNKGDNIRSQNGMVVLVMQDDGNCVLYPSANVNSGHAMFHTNTYPQGHTASVTRNGQFVIKNSSGDVIYTSDKSAGPQGDCKLMLQNDGNLVIYDGKDTPVWHTNTAGKLLK